MTRISNKIFGKSLRSSMTPTLSNLNSSCSSPLNSWIVWISNDITSCNAISNTISINLIHTVCAIVPLYINLLRVSITQINVVNLTTKAKIILFLTWLICSVSCWNIDVVSNCYSVRCTLLCKLC